MERYKLAIQPRDRDPFHLLDVDDFPASSIRIFGGSRSSPDLRVTVCSARPRLSVSIGIHESQHALDWGGHSALYGWAVVPGTSARGSMVPIRNGDSRQ